MTRRCFINRESQDRGQHESTTPPCQGLAEHVVSDCITFDRLRVALLPHFLYLFRLPALLPLSILPHSLLHIRYLQATVLASTSSLPTLSALASPTVSIDRVRPFEQTALKDCCEEGSARAAYLDLDRFPYVRTHEHF